jgi:DNA-binding NtrC family response regulator
MLLLRGLETRGLDMAQRDVLIIEHDPELRDLLRKIFETAGYACRLAADGREGMEAFRAGRPPLVLTDLRMPGVTGIELLCQTRAVDGDVAVIALTGAADMRTAIESLKLGVYAFLMEPINADEWLITAARALERRWLLIERRQYLQAYGQLQETDRATSARADLAERDVLILVVEEDAGGRHVFHEIFLGAGYRCILAGDVEEGLRVFRDSRPSLVLADLGMPMVRGGMRVRDAGIRLLLEIRQEDPDAAVIVASGWPAVEPAIESLKLGADAFLMKPINMDELLITVARALERRWLLIERRRYPPR